MRLIAAIIMLTILIPCLTRAEAPAEAWVMCNPESEVNVRNRPNKHATVEAHVYAGQKLELSGKKRGRWYHCYVPCEAGEGWIREDYLSFTEPEVYEDGRTFETTCGNLFARYSIKGNRCAKLKKGVRVTVYLAADEWSVTSRGFIKTEFLCEVPEDEDDLQQLPAP